MNLELLIRKKARQCLSPAIRKPVGSFCGWVRSYFLYPLMGLLFDLKGGIYRANGCSFVIPKDITTMSFRAAFLLDSYEEDERRLVKKYLRPEDSVLELGACLGVMACITNKMLQNPQRHVVVEANPYCLPYLHKNRQRNQASYLVEHCAASNQKEVTFSINPAFITGSGVGAAGVPVRLPGHSLNELNARYGPFSVLIMDIEGSELEQLESSLDSLRGFRMVLLELHEAVIGVPGVNRCRQLLEEAGFKMVERSYITEMWLRACLKTVASAILADVEPGFQPGGSSMAAKWTPIKPG